MFCVKFPFSPYCSCLINYKKESSMSKSHHKSHCVSVRLNDADFSLLESQRGEISQSVFLRDAWLNRKVSSVPSSATLEQWRILSRLSRDLIQVKRACNQGETSDNSNAIDSIEESLVSIDKIRTELLK